jgi:RNA polymerase-binding transcription factor DksA
MASKKLTKKQIEHLQQRLLRERERALRSLGQFDELAKQTADTQDSDMYSYSDHMADLGTDAMER